MKPGRWNGRLLAALALTCLWCNPEFALGERETRSPVVITTLGPVEGRTLDSHYVFTGIPYAASTAGDRRWREAGHRAAWEEVFDATRLGAVCPQPSRPGRDYAPEEQSEDCLNVNVVSPDIKDGADLPVMVWIHGGAFVSGSGREILAHGLPGLARRGVVLVSFNYRLGRFGFFAHPELTREQPDGPGGNYWLSDQIAALQWIKANVSAFGGDPGNITIFGVSAGGSSVNSLVASPAARGLFARAIVHSGGGLFNANRPLDRAERQGQDYTDRLGLPANDAVPALRRMSPQAILDTESGPPDFGAIVDGRLLTDAIAVSFARGDIADVDYVAGSTSNDASIFGYMGFDPAVMKERFGIDIEALRPIYGHSAKLDDAELLRQIQTDFIFTSGSDGLVRLAALNGHATYAFRFAYVQQALRGKVPGAPHGGDIPYVFGTLDSGSPRDLEISTMVQAYWANFARTGDPNGAGLPTWLRYRLPDPATLIIADKTRAETDFRSRQLVYWYDKWRAEAGVTIEMFPQAEEKPVSN